MGNAEMATIYSNQMSGAWRARCAKEEQQLMQQLAPHLYPPTEERAPAHHSAPFAVDAQPASSRDAGSSRNSSRQTVRGPATSRASQRPESKATTKMSTVTSAKRPNTAASTRSNSTVTSIASEATGARSHRTARPSDHDHLQKKLASLEAQVENERSA